MIKRYPIFTSNLKPIQKYYRFDMIDNKKSQSLYILMWLLFKVLPFCLLSAWPET